MLVAPADDQQLMNALAAAFTPEPGRGGAGGPKDRKAALLVFSQGDIPACHSHDTSSNPDGSCK